MSPTLPTTTTPAATTPVPVTTSVAPSPGALQAEVAQTAAGDIPDNQVFVAYAGPSFVMKYPEGWARSGDRQAVTFRDKNNIVRVVLAPGAAPTVASVAREISGLHGARASGSPKPTTIGGIRAVKATYTTTSAPNPVTGKRVTLSVDRYELARAGKRAIVDLGSPEGVDNIDAYRLMIQSFRIR